MALPYPLLALILFSYCILPPITLAHSELITSSPAPGETVGTNLREIRLEFSEPVGAASQILLFTTEFTPIPLTTYHDTLDPHTIYAPVNEVSTGSYIVQWTAVSQDGHIVAGSYQFGVQNRATLLTPTNLLLAFSLFIFGLIVLFWRRSNKNGRIPRRDTAVS